MNGLVRATRHTAQLSQLALLPFLAAGLLAFQADNPTEPAAMTELAHKYEHGIGRPRDAGQAILWYKRSAQLGEPNAMVALGDIYDEGSCVDQNMGEAVSWFRRAAALGNASAMQRLGRMIEYGRGVRSDRDEAIGWYRRAAEGGSAAAMTRLGELTGERTWLEKAVALKHAPAYALLAAKLDGQERSHLIRQGADLDDPRALFELARLEEQKDAARAAQLYRRSAEAGHPAAMSALARFAEKGLGGVMQSPGEAAVWYRKAADAGDPTGLLWAGRKVEEADPEAAYLLYERAASHKYPPAMTALANLRADCGLFRSAASLGDAEAMFAVATKCKAPDAQEWMAKAAAAGHAEALARTGKVNEAAAAGHRPSMLRLSATEPLWLQKSAEAGEPQAMRRYAATVTDPGEAARWFEKAAAAGEAEAMFEIGRRYAGGIGLMRDTAAATKWFRSAAETGHIGAMYQLGLLSGEAQWIRKAAEMGSPEAQVKLAESAEREQAIVLLTKAANGGYSVAASRLALLNGDAQALEQAASAGDVEAKTRLAEAALSRNKRRDAYRLFREAADAGYAPAMIRVGDCHMHGQGTWVSEVDAVNWYRKAALAGSAEALSKLKQLGKTQ